MSRSDWRKFLKIVGLASAAFLLASLLYVGGFYIGHASGEYEGQANSAAKQYPSDTQRIVDECFKLPSRAAASECVEEAYQTSHENQRAEYDLKTQREMSDWAWWVLVIGILQFFATIITLGLIKLTLDATLEAVKDTGIATNAMLTSNDMQQKAIRAYISVHQIHFSSPLVKDGKITGKFEYTNTGQSPARKLHHELQVGALLTEPPTPVETQELINYLGPVLEEQGPSDGDLGSGGKNYGTHTESVPQNLDQLIAAGQAIAFIRGWVRYTDVFGDVHHTHFCWHRDRAAVESAFHIVISLTGNSAD